MNKGKRILSLIMVAVFGFFQVFYTEKEVTYAQEKLLYLDKESSLVKYGLVQANQAFSPEEYTEIMEYEKYEKDFRKLVKKYECKGYIVDLSLEDYMDYRERNISFDIKKYLSKDKKTLSSNTISLASTSTFSNSSSGSGDSTYYYNTGITRPTQCKYSKYKLLSRVRKGDIFYEANSGYRITGHVGIIEGKFLYSNKYYIRIIEATPAYGVKRGVLDDTRVDEKRITVFRVDTNDTVRKKSVNFAISQIGKKYGLDFAKNTSSSESSWYCSELVWAAYMNQSLDIETRSTLNEPGVTPRDITTYSSETYTISISGATK